MKSIRNREDHITEKPFETVKCIKCGKEFSVMAIDKRSKICPQCDNNQKEDKSD
tara:strand:+ start:174 stop:335 length:162 start_codon:yes stop_codon:yes gene_type:complete